MANKITKEHAERIAAKLQAVIEKGAKHDLAKIYHGQRKVARYGIRRGSKKDMPHSYLPGQLFVSRTDCLALAECPMSREQWLEILREKGLLGGD